MQQNERSDIIVRAGGGAAMVMAALLMAGCGQKVSEEGFFGVWTVTGFTATDEATLTDEQAQALVGRKGVYSKHIAHFEESQCLKPGYVVHALGPDAFIERFGITPEALDFPDGDVTTVEITCFDTPLEEPLSLLPRSEEALVIAWNGVFFETHRKTGAPLSAR
ncbi:MULTISPECIES: hypothetical protein [Ectothiorhodospira]|uniref:hypothetical protein n=1 Tax=Ectothiorhodospira TaxID=1051 RepID=UPI0002E030E2|nr:MULTISPECIES: hypothetical protein [Ectothiorhodospira]MCG5512981.1 hypothetical protein [Ectothiorhodospira shaposhnikovii]